MSITDNDGTSDVHEQVVAAFAAGWSQPHPQAWDALLDEDVELHQPLLKCGTGRHVWHEELARLLTFMPDLTGRVIDWAGRDDAVFIELECTGTAGGRALTFRAVDRLTITAAGVVVRRDSYFDSVRVVARVMLRPRAWGSWWRSGVGPLPGRRRFLPSRKDAI